MRIPLNEFELHVRPEPLERGLSLYERGGVESVTTLAKGSLEAVVHDAEGTWHPQLQIKDEAIVHAQCACDPTQELPCRHAIAVVFALEAGQFKEGIATRSGKAPKEKAVGKRGRPKLDEEPAKAKPAKAKPPKPPKTAADILARVSHEDLVAFLLQECKLDKSIEVRLKAHFADMLPASTPAEVEKRIRETLKAAEGKSGKVNKSAMGVLLTRLQEWVQEGKRYLEAQQPTLAFAASHLTHQVLRELQHSPYADTEVVTAAIKTAQRTLEQLGSMVLSEADRSHIYEAAFAAVKSRYVHIELLLLASKICLKGKEFQEMDREFQRYNDDLPQVTEAHLAMVERVLGAKAAQDFAQKNATKRFFMMREIDQARKEGKLSKAEAIARKGLNINQNSPSRLGFWANLLDEIYGEMGDVDGRVALAMRLHRLGYRTERVSLKNIAAFAGRERWNSERKTLLQELDHRKWAHQETIVSLFTVDNDLEGLVEYLSNQTLADLITWGEVMWRRNPQVYWKALCAVGSRTLGPKTTISSNLWNNYIRTMVRVNGKEATEEFIRKLAAENPKNFVLAELARSIHQVTRHVSIGY